MMAAKLALGIDIGTTNVKACVLDTDTGGVIASGSHTHPLYHEIPGSAEQDANNYWSAVVSVIRQCLQFGNFSTDIGSVAISGLVGVTLPVDQDGIPLRRALIWMDSRSESECDDIRSAVGADTIRQNNGNRIAPWFIDPKALWLKKHDPEVFDATRCFLSPAGFCTFRLTGNFCMNTGDAGLFYPYDYKSACWNFELAESIGIPSSKLPALHPSCDVVGEVTARAAQETGLRAGTVVVAGGTDIGSAALGVGVVDSGQAFYSMGTGSNLGVLVDTQDAPEEDRVLKWPHVLPGLTLFDAPMAFTGASLKWYLESFGASEVDLASRLGLNVFDLITAQAKQIGGSADGLFYLPYLGNALAPNWNSNATGVFFGVRPNMGRGHFIRSIIEGVAFDLYSNVRVMNAAGIKFNELVLNGGPTKSRFWNQITADVTGIPLRVMNVDEAAPLGDAILAGVGAGLYSDPAVASKSIATTRETVDPDPRQHARYNTCFELWERAYRDLRGVMSEHRELTSELDAG